MNKYILEVTKKKSNIYISLASKLHANEQDTKQKTKPSCIKSLSCHGHSELSIHASR